MSQMEKLRAHKTALSDETFAKREYRLAQKSKYNTVKCMHLCCKKIRNCTYASTYIPLRYTEILWNVVFAGLWPLYLRRACIFSVPSELLTGLAVRQQLVLMLVIKVRVTFSASYTWKLMNTAHTVTYPESGLTTVGNLKLKVFCKV